MANELAIVNDADKELITTVLGGNLAQDIEFTQLDSAIEKIADHTKALTPEERVDASRFIDRFESRISDRIWNKKTKLDDFSLALELSATCSYDNIVSLNKRYGEALDILFARETLSSYQESWNEIKDMIQKCTEYREENMPDKPFIDGSTMTGLAIAKANREYELKLAMLDINVKKKETEVRRKFYTFMTKLKKDKEFKKFLKVLDEQAKAAKAASNIVEEKAQAAKMALLISDEDIRKALKEFHNFAKSLK